MPGTCTQYSIDNKKTKWDDDVKEIKGLLSSSIAHHHLYNIYLLNSSSFIMVIITKIQRNIKVLMNIRAEDEVFHGIITFCSNITITSN